MKTKTARKMATKLLREVPARSAHGNAGNSFKLFPLKVRDFTLRPGPGTRLTIDLDSTFML
jgi:hypothetical protein